MVNYPSSSTSPRLILMKSFCLLSALLFTSLNAIADDVRPYVGEDNCKVSNPYPREDERTTWTGGCKNGYAEGVGVLQWYYKDDPEMRYEGQLAAGKPNGPGHAFFTNKSNFEGTFKDGKWQGQGVYTYADGGTLSATFDDNAPVGEVLRTYPNGDVYVGYYAAGKRNGYGTMTYGLGGSYKGHWEDDQRNGQGTITYADGTTREGVFHDLKPQSDQPRTSYTMKRETPAIGTRIPEDAAYGTFLPYNKGYKDLSDEQKQIVRAMFPLLKDDEEPPYPLYGPLAITRGVTTIPRSIMAGGAVYINVNIGTDGIPLSAVVIKAPTPEVGKFVSSVLLLNKFKPARCAGKPCEMMYPYKMAYDLR